MVSGQTRPVVVHTLFPTGETGELLRKAGIPVHRDVDRAVAVLAGLRQQPLGEPVTLPPSAAPVTDTSYEGARRLFAEAAVAFPAAYTVRDQGGLAAVLATEGLTFPIVLKALGRPHKSEGGGVVLGLRDADQVRAAYDAMLARLDPAAVSVESMVDTSGGVELIIGCVRDPRFGPVLAVGLGGVFTEVLADTALAIGPVSPAGARRLLLSLRAAPLLIGARGREPVDLDALALLASRVSHVAAAHPDLVELELNPVFADAERVVALDARIVLGDCAQTVPTSLR
jgi:acyl-CoA synthetase (NDP forming)